MSTKNVSKCSYYGKVLLDLTGDTVTASTLKKGATAHDATGTKSQEHLQFLLLKQKQWT